MRRLYADSVRQADEWLGGVLDDLDGAGLLDDTVVIVSSDHGENLGEGGLITHAYSLDDRLIHVPLVTAGPVTLGDERALSLAELPRRLCEAIGIDHPWSVDDLPEGVAVAQFDPPIGSREDPRAVEIVKGWGLGDDALTRFVTPLTCATDGRLKLLRRGSDEYVLELAADPQELNPVPSGAGTTDGLEALRAALAHPSAVATAEAGAGAGTAAGDVSDDEVARIEERMRLLGYM
jgi:arylsulfatase A-like enzyme